MKRILTSLLPVLVVALAAPAFAGEGKCTASTQECLDYMASHYANKGWIGIEADKAEGGGWAIQTVVHGSPAEKAGLQAGDVLYGANGIEYSEENHEKLAELEKQMVPGADFTFMVKRDGKPTEVAVTLGEMPEDVFAKMVGKHMIEHASHEAGEE